MRRVGGHVDELLRLFIASWLLHGEAWPLGYYVEGDARMWCKLCRLESSFAAPIIFSASSSSRRPTLSPEHYSARRFKVLSSTSIQAHPVSSCSLFATTFVNNTPDTIPQTEELESLRAELVEVHLHSLEMEVPREEKGKVKAVESEKGLEKGVSVFIDGCTVLPRLIHVFMVRRWYFPLPTNSHWQHHFFRPQ
jgi:hypothetical protein